MKHEFLELISSPLMNLDHTYRYSGTKLVEDETLSQHIVDTIMMGLKLINKINHIAGYPVVSYQEYVMKAVYHDLEEVITGDIPRPLKYYNEQTTSSMKRVAEEVAHDFFASEFYASDMHYSTWADAKSGESGYILKIVDVLVVANKVVKEVSLLNNLYMLRVAHEVSHYLEELREDLFIRPKVFGGDRYKEVRLYILDILSGAIESMNEILETHETIMESLNIKRQSMI